MRPAVTLAGLVCLTLATSPLRATDVFLADTLWTGTGEPIHNAALVIEDGKVVAAGSRDTIEIPTGAVVHDLGAAQLVPGLVAAETTLAEGGRDEEQSVTPYIRAADGFDVFGDYDAWLAAGVTTVQLAPGSQRIMPGQGAVVKLAGDRDADKRVLRDLESLRVLLTQAAFNPPRIYEPPVGAVSEDRPFEPTKPQLAANLGDAVAGLRALLVARRAPGAADDLVLGTLDDVIAANRPFRVTARSASEILAAHQLMEEFELPTLLVGLDELDAVADAIAWDAPTLLGVILETENSLGSLGSIPVPGPNDSPDLVAWQRLELLAQHDMLGKTAITTGDNGWDDIWFSAGQMLAAGVERHQLLQMLTANPAALMRVEDRVGSLAPGKDADFVVLSGTPFAAETRVLHTFVGGRKVYDRTAANDTEVIHAATIYTADGPVQNAALTIRGKTIRGVGSSVSFPSDAKVTDFADAVIVPGFIDGEIEVGTGSSLSDRVQLNEPLGKLLVSDDAAVALTRQGGITTGLLASSRLPSPVLAFKLGDVPRVLREPVALRFNIEGNLTDAEKKTDATLKSAQAYVASWKKYEAELATYKQQFAEYERAKAAYDKAKAEREKKAEEAKKAEAEKQGDKKDEGAGKADEKGDAEDKKSTGDDAKKPDDQGQKDDGAKPKDDEKPLTEPQKPKEPAKPKTNGGLEPYKPLFTGEIAAILEVDNPLALKLGAKLFVDRYQLRTIFAVSGDADRAADALTGKSKAAVVVTPPLLRSEEGQSINRAERFIAAGVPTMIASGSGTGAKRLPYAVAHAVYRGLGSDDALQSLTSIPAELLQLKTIGRISRGADADLVVLSGPPFEADSRVLAVMIDGQWVYRETDTTASAKESP